MKTKNNMEEILGEDFFKDEIRSDFLVTAKRKKIWAVLLDMYLAFANVCEKYSLKYFVLGGTMLGAVRHNGFIPWDDDLDVGMMREDYNRFLNLAINDFSDPLFLQTPYTDPEYFISWARLRNSYSTGISKNFAHRKFNQGLFIDIFPLDFCDPNTAIADTEAIYACAKKCGAWMRKGSTVLTESQKLDEITYYTDNPLLEWEKIQNIASNPQYYGSGFVCNSVCTIANIRERVRPTHCYLNVEKHKFESIEVIIPSGYDELLTIQYGDYMKFPPIEKRGDKHSGIIFNADIPYTKFQYEK